MKKAQILSKAIALFFFAALTSNAVKANGEISSTSELKAKVNYVGATTDGVLFNLAYANEAGKKFTVKITNASGEVLYLNSFKDKKFQQTFKAPKDVTSKLTFEINSEKQAFQQSFNIQQKLVEEVVVSNN